MSLVFKLLLGGIGLAVFSISLMVYAAVEWGVGPVTWTSHSGMYIRAGDNASGRNPAVVAASRPVRHVYAPTTQSATFQKVINLLAAGNQDLAERMLARNLHQARSDGVPLDVEDAFLMAAVTRSRFEVDQADVWFQYVSQSAADTPHRAAAQCMLRLDQADGQISPDYTALCELSYEDPSDPLLLWLLGIECRSNRLSFEGVRHYQHLCELWKPGPVLVHQTFANELEDAGQLDQALEHRLIAVKLEPAPWDYDGLGNTLTALKRWREADDAYTHSTGLEPENPLYWRNWYCSMRQRGDAAGAERMAINYVTAERLMTGGPGVLILGSHPGATRLKQALANLVEQIMAGDLERANSLFAGTAADLDLLAAYIDSVAAAKQMRSQMQATFGDQIDQTMPGLDLAMRDTVLRNNNSVLFIRGNEVASSSAATPLGFGIDFIQLQGQWKVLTLASAPCRPEVHTARLRSYIATVEKITAGVKQGKFNNAQDARQAAVDAEQQLTGQAPPVQFR
jgi:tetratricopeptide (TPR) repeat protein